MKVAFLCVLFALIAIVYSVERHENERLVLTPYGYIPKGCVHHANEDEIVYFHDGILKIVTAEGQTRLERPAKCEFGNPIKSRDIHRGSRAEEPDGWAAYAKWLTQSDFNFFGGYWTVPANPTQDGLQTLFLFTGFQNAYFKRGVEAEVTSIIQPVLQWGNSEAGDEKYWAIASWFVAGENAVYSDLKGPLNNGDTIVGNMTLVGGSGTKWTIETNDLTMGLDTTLTVDTSVEEVDAFVTLEVYGINSCEDYPNGSDDFTNLYLEIGGKEVTPTWTPDTELGCEESVDIVDSTEVIINF
jgi:hypothetical protein